MHILRRLALAVSFLLFLGHQHSARAAAPLDPDPIDSVDTPRVINIVDDFLNFWDQTRGMSLRRQHRAFIRMVENKHRDYFDRAVYRSADEDERRIMLDQFLLRVPWQIAKIREFNKVAPGLVDQTLFDFRSRFSEYQQEQDIYIGPSLFRFDGSVRAVQNDTGIPDTLCLSAEVLSGYSPEQIQIVIAHELFHLYHFSFLRREATASQFHKAHMSLMVEGMAVAGAEAVYPYLDPSVYLNFSDGQLFQQESELMFNGRRFLRLMADGAPPEEYEPWFTNSFDVRIPPRGGYLLGYEVTRRVLATFTLEQMVRFSPAWLREHAEQQLSAIANEEVFLFAGGN